MFLDFFCFTIIKGRAGEDGLHGVGFWSDGDNSAGVKEDTGGSELDYTVRFGLAGEVVSRVLVYRESMCAETTVEHLRDWIVPIM